MAEQDINVGTTGNDGTGDKLRVAFIKIESNFDELYSNSSNTVNTILTVSNNTIYVENVANAAFASANQAGRVANNVQNYTNGAFGAANTVGVPVNTIFNMINTAYMVVNAAFGVANTAFQNTNLGIYYGGNMYFPNSSSIGIGTSTPQAPLSVVGNNAPQILTIGAMMDATGNNDYSIYNSVRNSSPGANASGDITITNDGATDFIDMGMTSGSYANAAWNILSAADGYLYMSANNLAIGTLANANIKFFIGGSTYQNLILNLSTVAMNVTVPTLLVAGQNVLANIIGLTTNAAAAFGAANTAGSVANNANAFNYGLSNTIGGLANQAGVYANNAGINANNWSNTQTYVTNYQTANYILLGTDIGKLVVANGPNVFVTANTFTPGQNIFLYNNTAANVTITQNTSVTLFLPGNPASTGNRTMLQRGFATLTCVLANTFVVTGTGVV